MRYSLLLVGFLSLFGLAQAQPVEYSRAVVSTTLEVIAPENEDPSAFQGGNEGRGGMNFRNMMDGETKITTYINGDKMKTSIKSEVIKSSIYRDHGAKTTTTVFQMMGEERAFFATDQDMMDMQRTRDSMMEQRRNRPTDSGAVRRPPGRDRTPTEVVLVNTSETKKIAGKTCIKAYLVTTLLLGNKDSTVIWYCPDFKIKNIVSPGSLNMLPMMGNMMPGGLQGLDKVPGFVMRYETRFRRDRLVQVEVTKLELDKAISDKEFEVPSSIDVKPINEMQNMFGPGGRGGFNRMRD